MSVTDGDREKAMFALFPELSNRVDGYIDGLTFSDEAEANMQAIAAALAEEREKARAPFRELANMVEQDALETAEPDDPDSAEHVRACALLFVAHSIHRAAEETE